MIEHVVDSKRTTGLAKGRKGVRLPLVRHKAHISLSPRIHGRKTWGQRLPRGGSKNPVLAE